MSSETAEGIRYRSHVTDALRCPVIACRRPSGTPLPLGLLASIWTLWDCAQLPYPEQRAASVLLDIDVPCEEHTAAILESLRPALDELAQREQEHQSKRADYLANERTRWRARHPAPARHPIPCAHCSEPFTPARSDARYCSTRCRVAAHRARPQ